MFDKIKEKVGSLDVASLIIGVIVGAFIAALLATGAPDIDYTALGGELVENELSVE